MAIYKINHTTPHIDETAFVADHAVLVGNIRLGANSSVWFGARIRADHEPITIGAQSNIQENCVLHTDPGFPVHIQDNVTIGHQATIHGCTIGENTLVGIQAIILNGAVIGKNCLIGAGALVTANKQFPDNALILGAPAKVVRLLSSEEILEITENAQHYCKLAQAYKKHMVRIS